MMAARDLTSASIRRSEEETSATGRAALAARLFVVAASLLALTALLAVSASAQRGREGSSVRASRRNLASGAAAFGLHEEMCDSTGRCEALNPTGSFSFVHISKCAGSSWIRILKKLLPGKFFPTQEAGMEYSVWYQNRRVPVDAHRLISLKSPRHHVWSLFTECKYDGWGKGVTKNTGFPRSGETPSNDTVDFDVWLDHFVPFKGTDMYNCYHPANYQSRALTSRVQNPHGVQRIPASERFEPNLTVANATYWDQDWVALTEFFHESKCLLYHRLGRNATEEAGAYVDSKCRCPKPEDNNDAHVTHHTKGHRSELRDLPSDILSKIAALTTIDTHIYRIALEQFMAEIAWLESDFALGRRVLCDSVLQRLEPELAYLEEGFNITKLYYETAGDGQSVA